jgi:hypothetical protein
MKNTLNTPKPVVTLKMLVDGMECLNRSQILARWKVTSSDLQRRIERYKPTTFVYANRHLYLASSVVTMMEPYTER